MIRGYSNNGSLFIGLIRGKLLDRLLAGERVCIPGSVDSNGVVHPHVCLFLRDNNAQLAMALGEYFPDGLEVGAPLDHVSTKEPE